jgi:hypothetical protein
VERKLSPGMRLIILAVKAIAAALATLRAVESLTEYTTPTMTRQPIGITTGGDPAPA